MATRVKWDKYETALLIETFWLIEKNPNDKKALIEKLSCDLRQRAINIGLEIDEKFRNVNGITMQLAPIGHAFFTDRPTLTTSVLFEEMVRVYRTDKERFEKILDEAKQQVLRGNDMRNSRENNRRVFAEWLINNNTTGIENGNVIKTLDSASSHSLKYMQIDLWELTNAKMFADVAKKMMRSNVFRVLRKRTADDFAKVAPLYLVYLKRISLKRNNVSEQEIKKEKVVKEVKDNNQVIGVKESNVSDLVGTEKSVVQSKPTLGGFYDWLLNNQKLAEKSCSSYASAVKTLDEYAQKSLTGNGTLLTDDREIIRTTIIALCEDEEIIRKNKEQHNRYVCALQKYAVFSGIQSEEVNLTKKPSGIASLVENQKVNEAGLGECNVTLNNTGADSSSGREIFYDWLLNDQQLAPKSCSSYASAIKVLDEYARYNMSKTGALFTEDKEIIQSTISALYEDPVVKKKNEEQHNRYFAALRRYETFSSVEFEKKAQSTDFVDTVSEEERARIKETVRKNYSFGFNYNSPIEVLRFRNYYYGDHELECSLGDGELVKVIKKTGFEFNGKIYVIASDAMARLQEIVNEKVQDNILIVYYDELYNENETWLYEEGVLSGEMMQKMVREMYPCFVYKPHYFLLSMTRNTEIDAINMEIERVWGGEVLQTFEELRTKLPYIPLEKIKQALSYSTQFKWNSFETYANKALFRITDEQLYAIKERVTQLCDEKGSAQFEELPIEEILTENYELSETAFYEIMFSYLSDEYIRNSKVITRKGETLDTTEEIIKFCQKSGTCKMSELEELMRNLAGEVRYPVIIEAANVAMVRVDEENFVADSSVNFEIEVIDGLLEDMIIDNGMGMKEVTTFGAFPYCGYPWNLFLLESFCRRFSEKFRYLCITPNSRNAGAIVKKTSTLDYHGVMAEALAKASVELNEESAYEYLVASGFMIRRQYANMADLLEKAMVIRERRK